MLQSYELSDALREYVSGKKPLPYILGLLLLVLNTVQIIQYKPNAPAGFLLLPMSLLYFGLHELAHAFTMFLPDILTAAAGSFSEILFGLLLVFAAVRTRYFFTALYCLIWLAFALKDTGQYMADARAQNLILFSPFGDNAIHDWNFVFGNLGVLNQDTLIGGAFSVAGYLVCLAAIIGAFKLISLMQWSKSDEAKKAHAAELAARLKSSQGYDSAEPVLSTNEPLAMRGSPQIGSSALASIYPDAIKGAMAVEPDVAEDSKQKPQPKDKL